MIAEGVPWLKILYEVSGKKAINVEGGVKSSPHRLGPSRVGTFCSFSFSRHPHLYPLPPLLLTHLPPVSTPFPHFPFYSLQYNNILMPINKLQLPMLCSINLPQCIKIAYLLTSKCKTLLLRSIFFKKKVCMLYYKKVCMLLSFLIKV